jgi:hypothetical protein
MAQPGSGRYGAGQVLAMIVILLLGIAFSPLILLLILWVRVHEWARTRRHRPGDAAGGANHADEG